MEKMHRQFNLMFNYSKKSFSSDEKSDAAEEEWDTVGDHQFFTLSFADRLAVFNQIAADLEF